MKKVITIIFLAMLTACKTTKQNPLTKCSFEAAKQYTYNR